jgi:hypothetical protein
MSAVLRFATAAVLLAGSLNASAYNALKNGDFNGSASSWNLSGTDGGSASYETTSGSPAGGSLRLEAFGANQTAHADQCVDISRWFVIDFSVRKFVDAEGGGGTHPFKVETFDAASCTGNVLSTITLPESGTPEGGDPASGWIEVSTLGTPLPSGAISAKVSLDAIAGASGYSYYLMDHVLLVPPDEIFPDDFEGS